MGHIPGATVCPVIILHLSPGSASLILVSWLFSDAPEGWIQRNRMEITHSPPGLFRDPRPGSGEASHLPERMPAVEQWHVEKCLENPGWERGLVLPQQCGLWNSLRRAPSQVWKPRSSHRDSARTAAPWLGKSSANDAGHWPGLPGVGSEHLGLLHLRVSPGERWIPSCGSSSGTAWGRCCCRS